MSSVQFRIGARFACAKQGCYKIYCFAQSMAMKTDFEVAADQNTVISGTNDSPCTELTQPNHNKPKIQLLASNAQYACVDEVGNVDAYRPTLTDSLIGCTINLRSDSRRPKLALNSACSTCASASNDASCHAGPYNCSLHANTAVHHTHHHRTKQATRSCKVAHAGRDPFHS